MFRTVPAALVVALFAGPALAQTEPAAPADQGSAKPVVTVNAETIYEKALQRRLKQIPPSEHAKARRELVNYLVETALVDQYLKAMKITVEPSEVEQKVAEFKTAAEKSGQKYEDILTAFMMTEAEFEDEIADLLRWDKFLDQQAPDEKLKAYYDQNTVMFDGSAVRARHILLPPETADAVATLKRIKAEVEAAGKQAAEELPKDADPLETESTVHAAIDAAFAKAAREHSGCPSKQDGGDLRWFPRVGAMDETFSAAAFALKPFEISEPVGTPFGQHLIMVIDRRSGVDDAKFEDLKQHVRDVYGMRLREAVIKQMKPRSKIVYVNAEDEAK